MEDETGILQQGIELGPLDRGGAQPQEGVGGEQQKAQEGRADQPLDRQHPRLQRRPQISAEYGDGPAVERQDQHPQQHGALVAAPGGREPVDQGLGAVGVLGDQGHRKVFLNIAGGQRPEGDHHKQQLQERAGAAEGHQHRIGPRRAEQRRASLNDGDEQGENQRELADFSCHTVSSPA